MNRKQLNTLSRKVIDAKTYEQRATILKRYAYRAGRVKSVGTWGYHLMKLSRVFNQLIETGDGSADSKKMPVDLFSVFAKQNSKLNFASFSALPGFTCPGAGACLKWCYSFKAFRYPAAFCRMLQNTILLIDRKYVITTAWDKLPDNVRVRLYVDGDFNNYSTMLLWFALCNRRPDLLVWGYSKSFELFLKHHDRGAKFPTNYVLNLSTGSIYDDDENIKKRMEELPVTRGWFHAVDINGKYDDGFKRYDNSDYHVEVRQQLRAITKHPRVFSCTGKCHACLPNNKPACAIPTFNIPIGIGNHG